MKNFRIYIALLASVFIVGLSSCVKEDGYVAGTPDLQNCYGVYFPNQKNLGTLEFEPLAEGDKGGYTATFTVRRVKSDDEITVPVTITPSEYFSASEIHFAKGQTETTFDVTLAPNAAIGVSYKCSILIEDPLYASSYSEYKAGMDFSSMVVRWERVYGPNGEEYGYWRDDFLTALNASGTFFSDKVIFEQREDMPGYFRLSNIYTPEYTWELFLKLFDVPESEAWKYCNPGEYIYIDATNKDKVNIPYQEAKTAYAEAFWAIGSYTADNWGAYLEVAPSDEQYGTYDKENGTISFPANGLIIAYSNNLAYGNQRGLFEVRLPGYAPNDYSVELSSGLSKDGVVDVAYSLGGDLSGIKYAVYPGALSEAASQSKAKAIDAGEASTPLSSTEGTISINNLEKTGVYTLVSANYDKKGKYVGFSYLQFTYIPKGEDYPVVLTAEMNATDKYSSLGYTSKNSLELYICGKEIKSAYIIILQGDYSGWSSEEMIEEFFNPAIERRQIAPVNQSVLAMINGDGYLDSTYGLMPGAPYTIMVYADNGYRKDVIAGTAWTKGEYNFIYDEYYYEPDIKNTKIYPIENPLMLEGEYDYYAVDMMGTEAVREKIGTVNLSIVKDWNENFTQIVPVGLIASGLLGKSAAEAGLDSDEMSLAFVKNDAGNSYIGTQLTLFSDELGNPAYYTVDGKINLPLAVGFLGNDSIGNFMMSVLFNDLNDALLYGGIVYGADGSVALAFADSYKYYSSYGVNYHGFGLAAYESGSYVSPMKIFSGFTQIMLVPKDASKFEALERPAGGAISKDIKFAGLNSPEDDSDKEENEFSIVGRIELENELMEQPLLKLD